MSNLWKFITQTHIKAQDEGEERVCLFHGLKVHNTMKHIMTMKRRSINIWQQFVVCCWTGAKHKICCLFRIQADKAKCQKLGHSILSGSLSFVGQKMWFIYPRASLELKLLTWKNWGLYCEGSGDRGHNITLYYNPVSKVKYCHSSPKDSNLKKLSIKRTSYITCIPSISFHFILWIY